MIVRGLLMGLLLVASVGCGEASRPSGGQSPSAEPPSSPSASGEPMDCARYADTYLTEDDAGRELRLAETTRFGFCLDERRHPLTELETSGCPFGLVSNWSLEGPDRYPIGFQITGTGACTVRNGTYRVRIVGIRNEDADA